MKTPYLDEMINELDGYIGSGDNYLSKTGNKKLTELKAIKEQLLLYSVVNSNCDKKPKKCKHKYGLFTHINNGRNLMFKCKKCKKDMTYKQLQIERKERK